MWQRAVSNLRHARLYRPDVDVNTIGTDSIQGAYSMLVTHTPEERLTEMLEDPSPTLRIYAFWALSERHLERKLKRSRIEVVSIDVQELTDAELLAGARESVGRCRWDKSRIVRDLIVNHDLCRQTARLIAAMVEEKVFNMGVTLVSSSLVKQLVLGDTADVLRAQQQLQTI